MRKNIVRFCSTSGRGISSFEGHCHWPTSLDADFDWKKVWTSFREASRNPNHQQIHFNYLGGTPFVGFVCLFLVNVLA